MSPEPLQPANVSLFLINSDYSRGKTLASVALTAPHEHVAVDAFRCRPYGSFCLFTTYNGSDSWLYNVSLVTRTVSLRTHLPNVKIHNLHVDLATGAAYTVLLSPGSAVVAEVFLGAVTALVDISAYLGAAGEVAPGATTQCSDVDIMWIAIRNLTVGATVPGTLVAVDLPGRSVKNAVALQEPFFASLWAACDDSTKVNKMGGSVMVANGTRVGYGTLDASGAFVATATVAVPEQSPPLALTALMSQPVGYGYFFALYPRATSPGGPVTSGYLGLGNFRGLTAIKLAPVDYYLTGAARVS